MARIPNDQLEQLKKDISVQRLAESQGIQLKRSGAELLGLCPFHDDKEPSLAINPKKNIWHCLGACKTGGSVIDWVMQAEGVSTRHAIELLLADYQPLVAGSMAGARPPRQPLLRCPNKSLPCDDGAPAYRPSLGIKRSTVRKLPTALEHNAEDTKLLRQVINYYHETLKQSPEALAYLEKRGISGEAINHFKLGFANRTLGYRLPEKNRKEGAAIRGQLQRLGLYRSSGHEHFTGSIVIPIIDETGQVTEVYGRKINDNLRKGSPKHLYLPGAHVGVWNVEALAASSEIILCESLIDALTFWCAGYCNVTASYGTEGFTADHLSAFKEHGIERVLIAYDRDAAGDKAADKLAKQLIADGIDVYRIQFPKGMDANSYALQVTPASKSLGVVIRSAQWMGSGKPKTITTEPAEIIEEPILAAASKNKPATKKGIISIPAEPVNESPPFVAQRIEETLPAAVVPEAPAPTVDADIKENEIIIALGGEPQHPASGSHKAIPGQNRRYRIRGLEKNLAYDVMKINLLASAPAFDGAGESIHVDTFDLYQQRPRGAFIKQAAVELGVKDDVIKADLGKILLKLEALQDAHIQQMQAPKKTVVEISEEDQQAALGLLKDRSLMQRIVDDYRRCGVVGEAMNKQVAYLACISRMLEAPLAIMVQSTSAAGKSSLMDAALAFVPAEHRIQYSAMTGQSLFYMSGQDLKHKILSIAEEAGASEASYALKLLQSEGELTIASTGKDGDTGKLITQEYHVEGPVMIFSTTTAIDLDEELLNRCLVLSVDEDREQTRAIHDLQRKRRTLEGLLQRKDKEQILQIHRNAQRLLKPLAVVNPYAEQLTFIDDRTRTRRDHEKYLTLIESITLLHQYQREIRTTLHDGQAIEYIEVTLADIELANRLAHEIMGRTLDELPPQTRRLLLLIDDMVTKQATALQMKKSDYRFSRRDIRAVTCWSDTQLKVHLSRLVEMEYLVTYRNGHAQRFMYELIYNGEGQQGEHFALGLMDVAGLKQAYDANRSGQKGERSGSGRGAVAPRSGGGQGSKTTAQARQDKASSLDEDKTTPEALIGNKNSGASYNGHTEAIHNDAPAISTLGAE
ncbi:MAG: toprim domain-containing protein [Candidatus Thiodiazotropha sp. (ex Lucinoma kastoroae)]|nr:toprim domain-containing protein [Candidatus Thiodiazotropha sp. (ex Lucinoma kastoroae)]